MSENTAKLHKRRKYGQVLDGAREIFMAEGFSAASVDDIAARANVSKATIYSYFPDKRALFAEVVRSEIRRHANLAQAEIDLGAPPRRVLTMAAQHLVKFILSDFGQQTYRICVAESDRFPDIAAEYYQSGPHFVRHELAEYFAHAVATEALIVDDFELAASQFVELCRADLFLKKLFHLKTRVTQAEIDRVVTGAVEMFLARYAPRA